MLVNLWILVVELVVLESSGMLCCEMVRSVVFLVGV